MHKLMLALMLTLTTHAAYAKAKGAPAKPTPAATPAPAPESLPIRKLVDGLRTAIQTSQAAKQEPDLVAVLLDALAESALTGVIHGHYALAGCGQALRTGGLGPDDARAFANDMAQNWQHLAAAYGRLAAQKAFDPALRNIFQSLALTTEKATQTAQLLAKWTEVPDDNQRAEAFNAAVEDYRGRVKALVVFAQGEPGK